MKYLVIFDFDGVIADSTESYFLLYKKTTEHFGKIFPVQTVKEFVEWYDSRWEQNFINVGFTKEELPNILHYEGNLVNYEKIPLYQGIKDVIDELSQTFTLAIASTTKKSHIETMLTREHMNRYFACVCGGGKEGSDKKGIIRSALDTTGIPAERAVMIGDTPMDVLSARANGIKSIAVSYGSSSISNLRKSNCDYLVNNPLQLKEQILKYFADIGG